MSPSSRLLAERVREARLGLELTQQELAVRCGVTVGTISAIERGITQDVTERVLAQLAEHLGVTIDDLVRGKRAIVQAPAASYSPALPRRDTRRATAAPTDPQRRGRTSSRGGHRR